MTIRPFEKSDAPLVQAFFDGMGGESRAFFNRGHGNERWAMSFFSDDPADIERNRYILRWMALEDGEMIGYVFLWELDKAVPWLGIAVSDRLKGRGLGKTLLAHARAYAEGEGKGGILLTTHTANLRGQSLYEGQEYQRMGMHTSGEILYLLRF